MALDAYLSHPREKHARYQNNHIYQNETSLVRFCVAHSFCGQAFIVSSFLYWVARGDRLFVGSPL